MSPDKKLSKARLTISIFLMLIGLALILTFIFRSLGDSSAEGESEGFLFSGSIAMFVGIILILLSGLKVVSSVVSAFTITLVVFAASLFITDSPMLGTKSLQIESTEEVVVEEVVEESADTVDVDDYEDYEAAEE